MKSFADRAIDYATRMVKGSVPTGRYARLSAERFLSDVRAAGKRGSKWVFDADRLDRVCRFIELFPHTRGEWANARGDDRLIKIADPWVFVFANIDGFYSRETGLRRFQEAVIFIARKNAKSTMVAARGLAGMLIDDEPGAEIYCGATSEKQAWEVFRPARLMMQHAEDVRGYYGVDVNARSIVRREDMSRFEPVIGKPGDGASPHVAIVDEYHEHDTDDMVSTMETGMGSRRQPLCLKVSTAGDFLGGPCHDEVALCRQLLDGVLEDDRKFAIIWEADDDVEWSSVEALEQANPMLDISVKRERLLRERDIALHSPRHQARYRTKHLNQWVGSRSAFFNLDGWQRGLRAEMKMEDFSGERCWIGIDLASRIDLASVCVTFQHDKGYACFGLHYLPEAAVNQPENELYRTFESAGALRVHDGEQIDYDLIEEDLLSVMRAHKVEAMVFDPHHGPMLMTRLQKAGANVIEFTQTAANYTPAMREAEAKVLGGNIAHTGDPVLTWAIGNVTAREDAKAMVFPRKERPQNKIDPAVAMLMSIAPAMTETMDDTESLRAMLSDPEPAYI